MSDKPTGPAHACTPYASAANTPDKKPRIRTTSLLHRKQRGEKIVAVTCYDATFARLLDETVDLVLVGDSLGMVIQGHESTLPVTLDDVLYHTRAVARGLQRAHLVADMPFMTYQVSPEEALRNAGRLIAEGGAQAVKLEGGMATAQTVRRLVDAGIPVMGHIGLQPQSVNAIGGYRIQGRTDEAARRIREDARALVEAGCYAMVIEGVPARLAEALTKELPIPTIGIGAGTGCDGQILVLYDLLGLDERFSPKFMKKYANLSTIVREGVGAYAADVRAGRFPGPEHAFE